MGSGFSIVTESSARPISESIVYHFNFHHPLIKPSHILCFGIELMTLDWVQHGEAHMSHPDKYLDIQTELSEHRLEPSWNCRRGWSFVGKTRPWPSDGTFALHPSSLSYHHIFDNIGHLNYRLLCDDTTRSRHYFKRSPIQLHDLSHLLITCSGSSLIEWRG
jgi:hypothetical protein